MRTIYYIPNHRCRLYQGPSSLATSPCTSCYKCDEKCVLDCEIISSVPRSCPGIEHLPVENLVPIVDAA